MFVAENINQMREIKREGQPRPRELGKKSMAEQIAHRTTGTIRNWNQALSLLLNSKDKNL